MQLVHYLALNSIPHTCRNKVVEIHGNLDLASQGRIVLPPQLEVQGDFHLADSQITALSDYLRVLGNLDASNTPVRMLPANTKVKGSIYLRNCELDEPLGLYDIFGDLDLSGSTLPGLQRGLRVHGSLNLYRTRIRELPDDLVVDEVLYLVDCTIMKLPNNLHVRKNLIASDSIFANGIPQDLHVAGKNIRMEEHCTFIQAGSGLRSRARAAVAAVV